MNAAMISADDRTAMMPTEEIGEFDEPINPAMYPQTEAMMSPMTRMNSTEMTMSVNACS